MSRSVIANCSLSIRPIKPTFFRIWLNSTLRNYFHHKLYFRWIIFFKVEDRSYELQVFCKDVCNENTKTELI